MDGRIASRMGQNKDSPCAGRIGVRPSLDVCIDITTGGGFSTLPKLTRINLRHS